MPLKLSFSGLCTLRVLLVSKFAHISFVTLQVLLFVFAGLWRLVRALSERRRTELAALLILYH